jgi:type IV pilus assembly protein PilZ
MEPVVLSVEYQRLNSFFSDYIHNIRRGVTFIDTERMLPIGTAFLFRLNLPTRSAPLELKGAVRWVVEPEKATPDQQPGMGIEFAYDTDAERAEVHAFVEKLMAESLGPALTQKLLR